MDFRPIGRMKNSILIGLLLGFAAPLLSFLLTYYTTLQQSIAPNKPIVLFVIAGAINLILMRIVYKKGFDNVGKGIMLMTFLGLLAVLYTQKLTI